MVKFERLLPKLMLAGLLVILAGCGQESSSGDSSAAEQMTDEMKGHMDAAEEAAGNMEDRASELADQAGQMADDAADKAAEMADDAADKAAEMADDAGDMANDLMDDAEEKSDEAAQAIKDAL